MVERSELVVRATVVGQQSAWNAEHTQIVTLTRLRVLSYMRGNGTQELVLRQFGGSIDGLESRIAGDAHLSRGQDVVLFLRRGDGVVFLTALALSAYYVQPEADGTLTVHRDLSELSFAEPDAQNRLQIRGPGAEPAETLAHLVSDVTALAGGAR
jgi:hypothetical protein